ncbi:MAG: hypothetical protein KKC77_19175 [Proteobacteria bacterium]|nr:hypothetical protein [Pseudomonadota bacterium]
MPKEDLFADVSSDTPIEKGTGGDPFADVSTSAKDLGLMPYVNQAIAGTVGGTIDFFTGGVLDAEKRIRTEMKRGGIKLPPVGKQPQTFTEHVGQTIGEVSGALPFGGAATKVLATGAKVGGMAQRVATPIWNSIIRHPYATMLGETMGAVGAGAGRFIAQEEKIENPLAKFAVEIGGGMAGGLSPLLLNTPTALALRSGKSILHQVSVPFSEKGAMWRAGKYLKGQVAKPAQIATEVTRGTIGDLPPAIASGESRLQTLYKSLVSQNPVINDREVETIGKSIIKLESAMRKLGYGSPELIEEVIAKRVATIEFNMDKRVANALNNAANKLGKIPTAQRRGAEAEVVRSELERIMKAEQRNTAEKWQEVNKAFEVGMEGTRKTYNEILSGLAKAQKEDVPKVLKGSIITNKKVNTTDIKEMQGLRSKLLETQRIARKEGQWNKARIAGDVADAILTDIETEATKTLSPDAASLKVAIAATKKFKDRFERGITGKILGYSKEGAPAIDPSLTLDVSIGRMGTKGAVDIEKVVVTPEARQATQKYLGRSFTEYAVDKKSGELNPIKANNWMKNNDEILDQFPELKTTLSDASKAQELATNTKVAMEARKAKIRDPKISVAERFLREPFLNKKIKNILDAPNPVRMTNQLVRQARKDTSGKALEGLKGGFVDDMLEVSTAGGAYNELGERTLSGKSLLGYLNKNSAALKEVFSSEQLDRMKKIGVELFKLEAHEKMPVRNVEVEMPDLASNALKMFSRIGGAQIGRVIAGWTGGGTVQTPQIVSERFKAFARFLSRDRAFQLIHDAITSPDPKLLNTLLLPLDKPKTSWKNILLVTKQINLWALGTGKRVMDDIVNEYRSESGVE